MHFLNVRCQETSATASSFILESHCAGGESAATSLLRAQSPFPLCSCFKRRLASLHIHPPSFAAHTYGAAPLPWVKRPSYARTVCPHHCRTPASFGRLRAYGCRSCDAELSLAHVDSLYKKPEPCSELGGRSSILPSLSPAPLLPCSPAPLLPPLLSSFGHSSLVPSPFSTILSP